MYNIYLKRKVREVPLAFDLDLDSAIRYCKGKTDLVIKDSEGKTYTKEELENVKSFMSRSGAEQDSRLSGGGPVSEDTSSELSGPDWYRTE